MTGTGIRLAPALIPIVPAVTTATDALPNQLVRVDASGGNVPITLPTTPLDGTSIGVLMTDQGLDPGTGLPTVVTVLPAGGDGINLSSVFGSTLGYKGQLVVYQYTASVAIWFTVSQGVSIDGLDTRYVLRNNPTAVLGQLTADTLAVAGTSPFTTGLIFFGLWNAAGPPDQGFWPTGAWVIDSNRANQICSAGGTPGTWMGGGVAGVAPVVVTTVQSQVTQSSAQLNGTINPGNLATTYHFDWGPTTAYGSTAPINDVLVGSDNTVHVVSQPITGLSGVTTYHYRLAATNAVSGAQGSDLSFTTLAPAVPPTVISESAPSASITQTTALLSADISPNGFATTYQFQYGTTVGYGLNLPSVFTTVGSPGNDFATYTVTANPVSLTANTIYHYRVVAINANGTTNGPDQTFQTTNVNTPTVVTNPATSIGVTSAILNGTVNPNGSATTYQFQYGTTTAYGFNLPSPALSAGSGSSPVTETATPNNLVQNTQYHFRLSATNAGGTIVGADRVFTTSVAPTGNVAKFARLTYSNTFPLPLSTDMAHGIALYLLQANGQSTSAGQIHAAATTAGTSMKVLCYADLVWSDTTHLTGLTDSLTYSTASANGWLAHNAAGNLIMNSSFTNSRLLNITLAGAQTAIVSHVTSLAQQGGFDGIWFDDCIATTRLMVDAQAAGNPATTPTWASTFSQVETAVANCLAAIVPKLQANGLVVFGNVANQTTNSGQASNPQRHFGPILAGSPKTGGVYMESWTDGGSGPGQQMFQSAGTVLQMGNAIALDSAGIKVMCNSQGKTNSALVFGLGVMMLCTTGNCYYMTDYLSGDNWISPEYPNALNSGSATSGVVTPGTPNGTGADTGLYVRTFQNCTVKVNTNAVQFATNPVTYGPGATINGVAGLTATIQ